MKTVLLLLFLSSTISWAQLIKITPQDTQRKQSYLVMRDGSVLRGRVLRQDSSMITVRRHDGEMSFVEADQVVTISATRPDEPAYSVPGSSTTPATVYVLKDGSRVEGKFVRRDSTMITVRKRSGQLTYFEPELLVRVDTLQAGMESADFPGSTDPSYANQFSPWLLTGQTAYNAQKGRFYYRNTLFALNEFDYGITRNWSVGASFITPITYVALANFYALNGFLINNTQLFSKLSVPLGDRFRLALHGQYRDNSYNGYYKRGPLMVQAIATIGTSQRNVTVGYGLTSRGKQHVYQPQSPYSSAAPGFVDISTPNQSFLTLGLMQKVSPLLTLISDNQINLGQFSYVYSESSQRVSLSFALRLDRRRHAFDLGLYGLVYRDTYKFNGHQVRILPYLGYNLLIGRN